MSAPRQARPALAAVERQDAWYVCWHGDRLDWIARFEKARGFDARGWAQSLAAAYNARRHAPGERPG